ncbi:MAG: BrnA antitoxin family protein [Microcoleus sp.]
MNNEFTSSKSQTDWERLDAMTDEDIDFSDCPEITPEMFAKAVVRRGLPNPKTKAQVTLRIDSDVLEWFKSQGSWLSDPDQRFTARIHESPSIVKYCICFMRE